MDLVGESRRGGNRGGRNNFTWDSVKKSDREYYLGNSVAGVRSRWSLPAKELACEGAKAVDDDIQSVRRQEKAVLDAALCGYSFAEAVRSALMETCDNGVDDDRGRITQDEKMEDKRPLSKEEKAEKALRKLERKRRREERRRRRAERQKRRAGRREGGAAQVDSSESERESIRSRTREDLGRSRRRRRKQRETGTKRKRADCMSSSDMLDSDPVHTRRSRVR